MTTLIPLAKDYYDRYFYNYRREELAVCSPQETVQMQLFSTAVLDKIYRLFQGGKIQGYVLDLPDRQRDRWGAKDTSEYERKLDALREAIWQQAFFLHLQNHATFSCAQITSYSGDAGNLPFLSHPEDLSFQSPDPKGRQKHEREIQEQIMQSTRADRNPFAIRVYRLLTQYSDKEGGKQTYILPYKMGEPLEASQCVS